MREIYMCRLACYSAVAFALLAFTHAQAEPLTDSRSGTTAGSAASSHAQLPSVGNATLNKGEAEHEHSFSGFYGGVHGGFATGKDDSGLR